MSRKGQLGQIEAMARSGNLVAAHAMALALCEADPRNGEAWLWAALLESDAATAARYARRGAQLEGSPRSTAVLGWALDWRSRRAAPGGWPDRLALLGSRPAPPATAPRGRALSWWLAVPLLALFLLTFLLWPRPSAAERALSEGSQLWLAGERVAALSRWEEAHALQPDDAATTEMLARAHLALWTDALRRGDPEPMRPHLEAAHALMPADPGIRNELEALGSYQVGRAAVAARDWAGAIRALERLHAIDPGYLDTASLLATARQGQREEEAMRLAARRQRLSASLGATPGTMLRGALDPAEAYSNLPGQTSMPRASLFANPSNKHIVVSINAQRMYVYENDTLIWNWIASTGEPARPTVPGRYRIQSKFENARSNVWSLWMPYWQGLYWAGSVENGIHGQVVFDAGGNLWEGYLGTQITFGCVMVSDYNAAQLFAWADMGTPVSIHWDWDPSWLPDENGDPIR